MGPSGFILFGLEGKMGSFGNLLHGHSVGGHWSRGRLPAYRVAGQAPETVGLDELSHFGKSGYDS